ncbi:E3 SUMO-protein ligase PIAS3 isoform X2 [Ornithorhynchus anatinus]|nr:E3 SUMO-protein ligase PIAS3 isoform X2 [Ornithorhynchus anatinus]
MVMSFRVSELQVLLGFAGRNKSGRKHELLSEALRLVRPGCGPGVPMKIKELYRRRFPRKVPAPADLALLHLGPPPAAPAPPPGPPAAPPPPPPLPSPKREPDGRRPASPARPVHPDVKMKRLPFYDVYDELIKPATLASTNSQRFEETHFTFALTPQQVQQILASRDVLPGAKCDYTVQVQLRFCLCETSCPQEDCFPPNLFIKVNGKLCPLPGYLPPTKNGAEPKRPSRPVNITPLARLSATVPNTIVVNWSSEFGRSYSLSVYLVKQLTSGTLLQKLRAKGIRNADHSRALIKEKLTADPDSEVATTSLRVSLMCPLGKMRLAVPCRALSCAHLQSFDAALYLQMNEKKPTWTCPVCDKKAPYESLVIDGLFLEILDSVSDCDEIQFMEDGSWCPMKPKKEAAEVCPPPGCGGLEAGPAFGAEGPAPEKKPKVEVIDLTLDSSSEEEEERDEGPPLAKKPRPVVAAATPGAKGTLSADHRPSSGLRTPPLAGDFLTGLPLPDYPPAFSLPGDIQGLDLFSFLQSENQRYGPSVITSLDEQDALSRFFQYRGAPQPPFLGPLAPVLAAASHRAASPPAAAPRPGGGVPAGPPAPGPALTACRSDVISLD